uniref:Zinc finger protein 598 (inferred by orthology to a human protein) n=1 Tax=Strongyloides venezuelensis TaxID=75913 RepID=A0A0K0FA07_STRVS
MNFISHNDSMLIFGTLIRNLDIYFMDSNLPVGKEANTPKDNRSKYRRRWSRRGKKGITKSEEEVGNSRTFLSSVNEKTLTSDSNAVKNIKRNGLDEKDDEKNKRRKRGRNYRRRKNVENKEEENDDIKHLSNNDTKDCTEENIESTSKKPENPRNIIYRRGRKTKEFGKNTNRSLIQNGVDKTEKKICAQSGIRNNGEASTSLSKEKKNLLNETEISLEIAKSIVSFNNVYSDISKNIIPELRCKQACPICCDSLEFAGMLPCNHCICMQCLLKQSILVGENTCFLCRSPFKSLVFFRVGSEIPTSYPPININDCRRRYSSKHNFNFQRRNDIIFGCSLTVLAFDAILQHCCWVCHINGTPCIFKTFHELERHYVIQHKRSFCSICVEYEQKLSVERIPFTSKELNLHLSGKITPFNNLVTNDHAKCTFCPLKTFYNSENLFRHYRLQHQTCEICHREINLFLVFDIYEDLLKHYESEHFPCQINNCKINGICFSSEIELQLHMTEVHSNNKKRKTLPLQIASENGKNKRKTNDVKQNKSKNLVSNGLNSSEGSTNFSIDQYSFPSLLSNPIEFHTLSTNNGPSFASIAAKPPPVEEEIPVKKEEVENIITSVTVNNCGNTKKRKSLSVDVGNNDMGDINNENSNSINSNVSTRLIKTQGNGDLVENKKQSSENNTIINIYDEEGTQQNGTECNTLVRKNIFWKIIQFILSPFTVIQSAIARLIATFRDFFIRP